MRAPGTRLADAQHDIAREYGFPSWPKLKAHVDAVRRAPGAFSSVGKGANSIADRVLAAHLREIETCVLFGIALLVSERYAVTLIDGTDEVRERKLTRAVWRKIDKW